MAVDERSRKLMHDALERTLGPDAAAALMEHLPPVGWADVATKRDLDALGREIEREHRALAETWRREHAALAAKVEGDLLAQKAELRAEIHIVARRQLAAFLAATTVIVGALNGGLYAALRLS